MEEMIINKSAYDYLIAQNINVNLLARFDVIPDEQLNGNFLLSTTKVASLVGVNNSRIRQVAPALQNLGYAKKNGSVWAFSNDAVDYLNNLPENRGRKKKLLKRKRRGSNG